MNIELKDFKPSDVIKDEDHEDFIFASKIWQKPYLSFLSSDFMQIETIKQDINGLKT